MSEQLILKSLSSQGVATITLNRPNIFNGYNEEFLIQLQGTISELESDTSVRVITLRGAGKHFSAGADVNIMDIYGETQLFVASKKRHFDIVKLLLDVGADANKENSNGETPLYVALEKGHLDVVNLLLSAGADANKENNTGETPLYIASDKGHLDIVKLLLSAGADVNKVNSNGETPLCIASWNGSLDIVKLLLDAGADPKKTTGYGKTPLHFAFEKLLRQLFISLANKTPLDAAFCESLDIVKLLSTVDVNKWNDDDKELMNWNFYIRAIKEILSNITVNADVITMLKILNDEEITRMAMEKYAKQSNATLGKRKSPGYLDLKF
jgi:ankyrin repeat protein